MPNPSCLPSFVGFFDVFKCSICFLVSSSYKRWYTCTVVPSSWAQLPPSEVYLPHHLRTWAPLIAYYYFYIFQGSYVFQLTYLPTYDSQIPSSHSSWTHSAHELNCYNQNQKRWKFSKEDARTPCKGPDDFPETKDRTRVFWPEIVAPSGKDREDHPGKVWYAAQDLTWNLWMHLSDVHQNGRGKRNPWKDPGSRADPCQVMVDQLTKRKPGMIVRSSSIRTVRIAMEMATKDGDAGSRDST